MSVSNHEKKLVVTSRSNDNFFSGQLGHNEYNVIVKMETTLVLLCVCRTGRRTDGVGRGEAVEDSRGVDGALDVSIVSIGVKAG